MKRIITIIFVLIVTNSLSAQKKEQGDYIQFDDRKNTVHGVYIGLTQHVGKLENEWASFTSLKLAYVANRKLEIGFVGTFFFSEVPNKMGIYRGDEALLIGSYGGLHLEPILFGNKFISVSFPVLIGGGAITLLEEREQGGYEFTSDEYENGKFDFDHFFIIEPGVNLLYNISRFVQIETGIKYRFSEKYNVPFYGKGDMSGFSAGLGIKIGIFNMGRKKKVKDDFN
ncbi:hypothetical protein [Wocania ichthyoenteri]|uniref:hypothetical protein n=1 Tax=Wocania ichthyoenteri TaxID=1230531 RepID=UPI00053EB624|nr:hypothetical protein [Wocania ichthyoenteri]